MKKLLSVVLAFIILAGLLSPIEARAASSTSQAGIVSLASGRLNVRNGSSSDAAIVTRLYNGSYVTLLSKIGSWWHVEYAKGQYGYCHADYISPASGSAAIVSTQSARLNVRSGAGTAYTKLGSLNKGETVLVLSRSGNWSRILYHGSKTGYVSSQYLSGSAETYPALSLPVVSYKQTDARWSSITLGSSGKTMAKIGCATTAIAMLESYRTGRSITPNVLAQQLSYTSTGSVYWPDDYLPVTSSSGQLSAIYRLLQQGKPVLYGVKNSSGAQHWVIITGYTGSNTLSASRFSINDPGSASRTNLQQLLDTYPLFYKYFYYH